jgi:deazaflavin-dependent oxidoreductase (nitroreductase family)
VSEDHEYAYLTTTGRRTGKPHTVEIWYRRIGDVVWFLSGGLHNADWVKNLQADPRATIAIGEEVLTGTAFLDDQAATDARRGLAARYQGWQEGEPLSGWAEHSLAVGVRLD